MFSVLKDIKQEHPLLRIVAGMDANHFLDQNNLKSEGRDIFYMTPSKDDKPTTIKKRSFLQAQYKKAGKAVSEVKDHIVTSH